MKRILTICTIFMTLSIFIGCDALHTVSENKVTAQGAPYELVVVCDYPQWDGALGDTLRRIFTPSIPYLTQEEPIFDLLRVTSRGYNNLVTRHRNIVKTQISPTIDSARVVVQYDLNATPQIVMTIQGNSEEAIIERLSENRDQIIGALEAAERDRAVDFAARFGVRQLEQLVEQKFGFEMDIPQGYTLRNDMDHFLWLSYEYPTASQGVAIYSYPATKGLRSLAKEDLMKARDLNVAKIPGPSEGSYMITFDEYPPDYRLFRLNGRIWAEMRGLWEVEGDFMGGPFVSYSTLDTSCGDVVTIDCYVYSPKLGKRNFMRGVEHLIYGIRFPTSERE